MVEAFLKDSKESPETVEAARKLLADTAASGQQIDAMLSRHARRWQLHRLALVDRNILRLATCELLAGKTPFKVVITEAIRLGQEFSTVDSPRFINGVLDAIVKELGLDAAEEQS
jgi:N utilization substance protein B